MTLGNRLARRDCGVGSGGRDLNSILQSELAPPRGAGRAKINAALSTLRSAGPSGVARTGVFCDKVKLAVIVQETILRSGSTRLECNAPLCAKPPFLVQRF